MSSDINKYDLSILTSIKNELENEKNRFKYSSYNTFKSGYIYKCNDPYISKMNSKLNSMYEKTYNGYKNIYTWFKDYIKTATQLENSLANDSNEVTEAQLNNFISSKLMNLSSNLSIDELFSFAKKSVNDLMPIVIEAAKIESIKEAEKKNNSFLNKIASKISSIGSTIGTTFVSGVEGVVSVGESIWDSVRIGADGLVGTTMYGLGFITYNDLEQGKNEIYEKVGNDDTKELFDLIWDGDEMSKIKENTFKFDTTRQVGNMVGETGFIIALDYVGVPAPITAGVNGFSNKIESAYSTGANYEDAVLAATTKGFWDGFQWYIGGEISNLSPFKKEAANVATRVTLDSLDGAFEGIVDPSISTIYRDGYYDNNNNYIEFNNNDSYIERFSKLFKESGGWGNVAINGAFSGLLSGASEGVQIFKKNNINSETLIDDKLTKKLDSSDINNNILDTKTKQTLSENNFTKKTNMKSKIYKIKDKIEKIIDGKNIEINSKDTKSTSLNMKNIENNSKTNIEDIIKRHNDLVDEINLADANIKQGIIETLKKQNLPINDENISKMMKYINDGNYNFITSQNNWRNVVKNSIEYKNSISTEKYQLEKLIKDEINSELRIKKNNFVNNMNKNTQYFLDKNNCKIVGSFEGINIAAKNQNEYNAIKDYLEYIKTKNPKFMADLNDKGLIIVQQDKEGAYYQPGTSLVVFDKHIIDKKNEATFYHEVGHYYDYLNKRMDFINDRYNAILEPMKKNADKNFNMFISDYKNVENKTKMLMENQNIQEIIDDNLKLHVTSDMSSSEISIIRKKIYDSVYKVILSKEGYPQISDIFDAIYKGKIWDNYGFFGHGSEYYERDMYSCSTETIANVSSLYNMGKLDLLDKYFGTEVRTKLVKMYEDIIDWKGL